MNTQHIALFPRAITVGKRARPPLQAFKWGLASSLAGIGLPGIIAGMFLALAGLGIAEATLMSIALATRSTALGASAAVLGALPLVLGAIATPLTAVMAANGPAHWLGFLTVSGMVAAALTSASARMVARSGMRVDLQH